MNPLRFVSLTVVTAILVVACAGPARESQETTTSSTTLPSQTTPPPPVGSGDPPDVDMSISSVPLDEVYFDTFDGGAIRLSDSTPELRSRLLDAIPPIDQPVYGDAASGDWLSPDDSVLGYLAGDQAYAYPFKILNFHEIVNDALDDVPVLISYCPLCGSGIVYDRRLDGEVLSFGNTSALYESDLVMVDRATGSYWWQVAGTAIVGPLTGSELEALPSQVATWEQWKSQHPDTLVLSRETGFERPYERDSFASYTDFIDSGNFAFPVGEVSRDARLRASALVVGIVLDGITRAYPVEGRTDPVNDVLGVAPIVVFPVDGGATVFSSVVGTESLEFQLDDRGFVDVTTGSVWSPDGLAVSGPYQGRSLTRIPSRTTFWFAMVGAFPEVELFTD